MQREADVVVSLSKYGSDSVADLELRDLLSYPFNYAATV